MVTSKRNRSYPKSTNYTYVIQALKYLPAQEVNKSQIYSPQYDDNSFANLTISNIIYADNLETATTSRTFFNPRDCTVQEINRSN